VFVHRVFVQYVFVHRVFVMCLFTMCFGQRSVFRAKQMLAMDPES